ncbi:hypothetical protein LCGC14_2480150 [marine sediment metagenome]|uniref:Lipoprotein n=1 Tax=marine sediment metagenome TaxID=412755 RepID=A0A0F9DJW4_9ZZZZ
MKFKIYMVLLLVVAFTAMGCSLKGPTAKIVERAIEAKVMPKKSLPTKIIHTVVVKPILGFAKADAETAIKWVDKRIAGGLLSPDLELEAKLCPQAVIALSELRDDLMNPSEIEGTKGFVYFGTLKKYGGDPTSNARQLLKTLVSDCVELLPDDSAMLRFLSR